VVVVCDRQGKWARIPGAVGLIWGFTDTHSMQNCEAALLSFQPAGDYIHTRAYLFMYTDSCLAPA
jgi:hypothetical protein